MPLIFCEEIPHLATVNANGFHHLVCLCYWNSRIVETLRNKEGPSDSASVSRRRDGNEKLSHLRIALIAILRSSKIAPIFLRALQERHKVTDANNIDTTPQTIIEVEHRCEHHVAA